MKQQDLKIDCSSVSVKENTLSSIVKIHPNPFKDIFYIEAESEILELTIVDINGKILMSQNNFQSAKVSLDKALLPAGIYFLKLRTRKGFSHYKLLKN